MFWSCNSEAENKNGFSIDLKEMSGWECVLELMSF